jgi:hypothetical protein
LKRLVLAGLGVLLLLFRLEDQVFRRRLVDKFPDFRHCIGVIGKIAGIRLLRKGNRAKEKDDGCRGKPKI